MLVIVKPMLPKWIYITIHLVIVIVVNVLEYISTGFSFLFLKPWRVYLEVGFVILCHFPMVFQFIRTIVLLIFYTMHTTHKCDMILLLIVLSLENIRIYIYFPNHCNVIAYIKVPINEIFCICAVL